MSLMEFAAAVLLLELTPGPNMAYLAALSLSRGRTAGLFAVMGVALGLAVHAGLAAVGVGILVEQSTLVYETLRWLGVGYLLYLAWEGWTDDKENSPEKTALHESAGPLFWRGFLSNIFNPKSILFFVTVVPEFVRTDAGAPGVTAQMTLLGTVYVGIATLIHTIIVAMASQLKPWLAAGPRRDIVRKLLSIALAFVAVWLAWSTRR